MSAPFENMLIVVPGKELPDWVVERLNGDIAKDGSFEFEASDGPTTVRAGHAIFQINGGAYTCAPKEVQAKLAVVIGTENKVVAELIEKTEGERDRVNAARRETYSSNRKPSPTDPDYRPKLKPIIGSPPAPQFVAVDSLLVDDSYQRSIEGGASRKMIVKIAENWDWRLCLPLLVSRRDGRLYVIDGQHRKEAAELRGDIAHLPVVVFDFNDPKAEAELFVEANRSRRAMSKLDDFHAAVVAGDPACVAINDVVTAAGLKVGRVQAWQNWKPGEVVFTSVIGRALKAHGHTACVRALAIIARAFDGMTLVGGGSIFEGVMAFLHQRGKENLPVEDTLLELVLSSVGIPGWKEAIEGTDGPEERVGAMLAAIRQNYSEAEAE